MTLGTKPAIWWVRRDFRLQDNPALRAAVDEGEAVLPLFVLDPVLLRSAGHGRRSWLLAALQALDADLRDAGGPGLSVVHGRPATEVVAVAREVGAASVHVAADFGPYGRRRDQAVDAALAGSEIRLHSTGSPYAVAPGTLFTRSTGGPFQVFTPFHRAWQEHGVHDPAPPVPAESVAWLASARRTTPPAADRDLAELAGERPAHRQWRTWLEREPAGARDYARLHDDPGADATSRLSVALRWGHLHPRTMLADLAGLRCAGAAACARQIAWRDFFADVLFHRPDAVSEPVRSEFRRMAYEDLDQPETRRRLEAWQQGRTGYPLVDAGMRQLLVEGWMHNRVRLVVASFLVKDLHLGWWHGARWFMEQLRDGDLASNQLNWQWVAGCGTDAAPYFRVFNPTGQAKKFDPQGAYVRRYVPELADVPLEQLHEPWKAPGGPPNGYPPPLVDHAVERQESLDRYAEIRR